MKNKGLIILVLLPAFLLSGCGSNKEINGFKYNGPIKTKINMLFESPAFGNNQMMPVKYSCNGQDINPPLIIKGVPAEAESLVLIVDDLDAAGGSWIHWLVWNINPAIKRIDENSIPKDGVQGINSFGRREWGGPCPPTGVHRYQFKLYALKNKLDLSARSRADEVISAMQDALIDSVVLTGLYTRH